MGRMSAVVVLMLLVIAPVAAAEESDSLLRALGSGSPEVRRTAREKLLEMGERAVPLLAEGISSPDAVAALACADLLGEGAWRRARSPLRAVLEDDARPGLLRRACCRALGKAGDYRDIELLGTLVVQYPEAALALIEIAEPECVEVLLTPEAGAATFPEIPYALARFGHERGVDTLIGMLGSQNALGARHYLRVLAGRDYGAEPDGWMSWRGRERLADRLGSADWDVSEEAMAEVLATFNADGESAALKDDLLALAKDSRRPLEVRSKALLAIGLAGFAPFGPDLVEILNNDPDGQIRVYAAEALGRVGYAPAAVDLAWYLIFDEDPFRKLSAKGSTIRYYTIDSEVSKALVRMGITGGLDYLIRQLGEEHRVRVHHQALRTLHGVTGQNFGYRPDARRVDRQAAALRWRQWFDENRGAIELVGNVDLEDKEFRARVQRLIDTLGGYKFLTMSRARQMLVLLGEVALPELTAGLTRPEMHIRVHCAEVLGWIRSKAARPDLARALEDPSREVRTAAAVALGEIGPGEAAPAVLKALGDEVPDVRIEAALALAQVDPKLAVPALRKALDRPANDIEAFRREAWYALAAHGDPGAVDQLAGLLSVPDRASRQETADRLAALTGRDPGVEEPQIDEWKAWWQVSRGSYTPRGR
jgi:HEAT repeat protein